MNGPHHRTCHAAGGSRVTEGCGRTHPPHPAARATVTATAHGFLATRHGIRRRPAEAWGSADGRSWRRIGRIPFVPINRDSVDVPVIVPFGPGYVAIGNGWPWSAATEAFVPSKGTARTLARWGRDATGVVIRAAVVWRDRLVVVGFVGALDSSHEHALVWSAELVP